MGLRLIVASQLACFTLLLFIGLQTLMRLVSWVMKKQASTMSYESVGLSPEWKVWVEMDHIENDDESQSGTEDVAFCVISSRLTMLRLLVMMAPRKEQGGEEKIQQKHWYSDCRFSLFQRVNLARLWSAFRLAPMIFTFSFFYRRCSSSKSRIGSFCLL